MLALVRITLPTRPATASASRIYLLFRKASVDVHVIEHRGQNTAASACRRRHDNVLIGIFLTHRIGVGSQKAVHGHIGALVVASLFIEKLGLSVDAEASFMASQIVFR